MNRLFPHPLLIITLIISWLVLNSFSIGHLILGTAIALAAAQGLAALEPVKPHIRRWEKIPVLIGITLIDIIKSNIAVVSWLLRWDNSPRKPGFVRIPLQLRDPTGLAILALIITSTPGTAWVDYSDSNSDLLIHVFDLVNEQEWIDTIKSRYEHYLLEIFE